MRCWMSYEGGCEIGGVTFTGGNQRLPYVYEAGGLSINSRGYKGSMHFVHNCRFVENAGPEGGGIQCYLTTIRDCDFLRNRAEFGGAIANLGDLDSSSVIERCEFRENSANYGGAVATASGVLRCKFIGNTSTYDGGALYLIGRPTSEAAVVEQSLFAGNVAGGIGGAVAPHPSLGNGGIILQCTIVDNRAGWGGGIHAHNTTIVQSILDGNSATIAGPQISQGNGTLLVSNSLLRGGSQGIYRVFNGAQDLFRVFDADPRFADPAGPDGDRSNAIDNNYRLLPDSPCIDRIAPGYAAGLDLDGLPRIEHGPGSTEARSDLGCYEWRQTCPADFDNSGGTPDMTDLAAFFEAFSAGDAAADVNKSGGTPDSDDIEAFFNVWLAGGC